MRMDDPAMDRRPKGEALRKEPRPAANEEKATEKPQSSAKDTDEKEKSDSSLAMTLREAEIIAQNLKESGTRR